MRIMICVLILCLSGSLFAAGGGAMPSSPQPSVPQKTPGEKAVDSYNAGLKNRDKALKYLEEAATQSSEKKVAKLKRKANKQFVRAANNFERAIGYEPRLYQAHGSLGYALKQTGDFSGALAAYNQCLKLRPSYTPAIEYQAEAHLMLGELELVKEAYRKLVTMDPEKAAMLALAMDAWVAKPPDSVVAGQVTEMRAWMDANIQS